MSTSPATVDFLLDQLTGIGPMGVRKMFGEYCLYWADKPIGLVCDNQLFLKPTAAGRGLMATVTEGSPYPGAKPHLLVTADLWDDRPWLGQLIQATAAELPPPKPKKKKA